MKARKHRVTMFTLATVLALSIPLVLAGGKTPDVIAKSNGFPSGMHFNLNIHGRDFSAGDPGTVEPGGNSVFVDLYGATIIEYVSDRSGTELVATDPNGADGKVSVSIPKQVALIDDLGQTVITPVAGYYVFGRILAKPQNGKTDERSNILFSPNRVTSAVDIVTGADGTEVSLGLITWNATYLDEGDAFYRFEDPTATAKGKSVAREMTHLFEFTGWVVNPILDTNGPLGVPDGQITILDVPEGDYDLNPLTAPNRDYNNDTFVNDQDIVAWLQDQALLGLATEYTNEWIFNIADLVTTEGTITNDGTKLFQVRFYPYFGE